MKKRWLFVLIPLLLVINLVIRVPFSEWTRFASDRKAAKLPPQIQASFEKHGEAYRETALALTNMMDQYGIRSIFTCGNQTVKRVLPASLIPAEATQVREEARSKVSNLLETTGIPYDRIFIPESSVFYYPEAAVVFRCAVMEGSEEYCWIDLIYSPQWQQHKAEKKIHTVLGEDLSIQIDENWCMVILYRE